MKTKSSSKTETKKLTLHQKIEAFMKDASFQKEVYFFQLKIQLTTKILKNFVRAFLIPGHTLFYNTKENTEKERKEYGYFVNDRSSLFILSKVLGIKSLVDLGCGAGVVISCLENHLRYVKGYDNEESLVNMANSIGYSKQLAKVKDITLLTKEDIEDFDAVYFWEPIIDHEMATKFVKNLLKIMKKNQYIFYYNSGKIGSLLEEHGLKKGKEILSAPEWYNEITIYQKIK